MKRHQAQKVTRQAIAKSLGVSVTRLKQIERQLRRGTKGADPSANISPDLMTVQERTPRARTYDFNSYLRAIKQDPNLATCLIVIANAIMFADWDIMDMETGALVEDESAPVVQIFENPNNYQTWYEFIEKLVYYQEGTGNNFLLEDAHSVMGNPTALHVLRPDRIRIVPDPYTFVRRYQYLTTINTAGKQAIDLDPEHVHHMMYSSPVDEHWGMGRVEVSERTYNIDIAAQEYILRYFENDAKPGLILKTAGNLQPDKERQLRRQVEEAHQGFRNAYRMMILQGGLDIAKANENPREADFHTSRKAFAQQIFSIFGIPPIKAGIVDNANRSNSVVQERSFYRDAIMPRLKRYASLLTKVAKKFGNYAFVFDDVVIEDEELDSQIAERLFGLGGLTPNEVRTQYLGLEAVKGNPAMDKFYVKNTFVPIETAGQHAVTPTPGEPATAPAKPKPTTPAPSNPVEAKHSYEPKILPKAGGYKFLTITKQPKPHGTPLQRKIHGKILTERLHVQHEYRMEAAKYFMAQRDRVIQRFLASSPQKWMAGAIQRKEALPDYFNKDGEDGIWVRLWRRLFGDTLAEQYKNTTDLLGYNADYDFKPGRSDFDTTVDKLALGVTRVNDTTKDKLDAVIKDGLKRGYSPTQIARGVASDDYAGIYGSFYDFSKERSQLIARTEASRAMDKSNLHAYDDMGVTVVDVIGCEDFEKMSGEEYGCNSQNIPIDKAWDIEFHPNHTGTIVPRIGQKLLVPTIKAVLRFKIGSFQEAA